MQNKERGTVEGSHSCQVLCYELIMMLGMLV